MLEFLWLGDSEECYGICQHIPRWKTVFGSAFATDSKINQDWPTFLARFALQGEKSLRESKYYTIIYSINPHINCSLPHIEHHTFHLLNSKKKGFQATSPGLIPLMELAGWAYRSGLCDQSTTQLVLQKNVQASSIDLSFII